MHATTTGAEQMCAKPIYSGLLKAIDLSDVGGIITLFTDGTATDIDLENQIINNATAKQITVNHFCLSSRTINEKFLVATSQLSVFCLKLNKLKSWPEIIEVEMR